MAYEAELEKISNRMRKYGIGEQDLQGVGDAFRYAEQKLSGKRFASGRSVFSHNLVVARVLVGLGLGAEAVEAALLHNLGAWKTNPDDLEKEFGRGVYELIDGRQKMRDCIVAGLKEKDTKHAEEVVMLMSNDLRVLLLGAADKIADMHRFDDFDDAKQKRTLQEVRQAYVPLVNKLGIFRLRTQLEDLMLKHLKPATYEELTIKLKRRRKKRERRVEKFRMALKRKLGEAGMDAEVHGRAKHVYGIYDKMRRRNKTFEEIYDLSAVRVITGSVEGCYKALGVVHANWRPLPWEFNDYIAKPKPNGYQSLHTTVIGQESRPVEVQIRSREMHNMAEFGAAAHWRYKGLKGSGRYCKILEYLKQTVGLHERTQGGLAEHLKPAHEHEIFVLTPKRQVIELPENATVLDFAYAVHTELGHRCKSAKVNGMVVGIARTLKNGDMVEILTSTKQKPGRHWLGIVKTDKAAQRIRGALAIPHTKNRGILPQPKANVVKTSDARVRMANCCMPITGDDIIGVKTTKRKISVHRADCQGLGRIPAGRFVDVAWTGTQGGEYNVAITVSARDRVGLLADILKVISADDINVNVARADESRGSTAECFFELSVGGSKQLAWVMDKIKGVPGVKRVVRT